MVDSGERSTDAFVTSSAVVAAAVASVEVADSVKAAPVVIGVLSTSTVEGEEAISECEVTDDGLDTSVNSVTCVDVLSTFGGVMLLVGRVTGDEEVVLGASVESSVEGEGVGVSAVDVTPTKEADVVSIVLGVIVVGSEGDSAS